MTTYFVFVISSYFNP